ncbi:hypothetical protein K435DRAFT_852329 [Dendrothele bispora CBS 962.96]|uniref:Uncharacterized protein n=1 Tax=Dendrothele bispora (strain CBS 962.96) TaxID=1314807 RepID=A0A4S8MJH4_DENBC|nr:hypothetical protein K435DRAFT_852329 [Dendrothele bispora CBS 962.96]
MTLSEEVQEFLSFLTPHHPTEQLLQNSLSSPGIKTNHHCYHPLLTRSSGNPEGRFRNTLASRPVKVWSSPEGLCLRARRGSSNLEKMMTPRKANFWLSRVDEGRVWAVVSQKDTLLRLGRDAVVAYQLGARTVTFANPSAYYSLFTQIPDALRADPDHCSVSRLANTDGVKRMVIYNADESDPSARYATTSSQGMVTSMKMGSFVGDTIAKELFIQSEKPLLLELETEVEAEDEGADVDTDAAEVERRA